MNYAEQLAATKLRKERDAEESYKEFLGWIADGVSPLIDNGTLTMAQGEIVMLSVARAINAGVSVKKPKQPLRP